MRKIVMFVFSVLFVIFQDTFASVGKQATGDGKVQFLTSPNANSH